MEALSASIKQIPQPPERGCLVAMWSPHPELETYASMSPRSTTPRCTSPWRWCARRSTCRCSERSTPRWPHTWMTCHQVGAGANGDWLLGPDRVLFHATPAPSLPWLPKLLCNAGPSLGPHPRLVTCPHARRQAWASRAALRARCSRRCTARPSRPAGSTSTWCAVERKALSKRRAAFQWFAGPSACLAAALGHTGAAKRLNPGLRASTLSRFELRACCDTIGAQSNAASRDPSPSHPASPLIRWSCWSGPRRWRSSARCARRSAA